MVFLSLGQYQDSIAAGVRIVSIRAVSRLVDKAHLHGNISVHTASHAPAGVRREGRKPAKRAARLAHGHCQQKAYIVSPVTPKTSGSRDKRRFLVRTQCFFFFLILLYLLFNLAE